MADAITVTQLVRVLEHEAHNDAAERLLCGEDPGAVLSQLGEPHYHDQASRDAAHLFEAIVAGRVQVLKDTY
jgi:hypothetical protein